MTFLQVKRDLIDYVNRPETEQVGSAGFGVTLIELAGREINKAIKWANRRHAFKYAEKRIKYAYPANTTFVTKSTISADILSFLTIEVGNSAGADFGLPLQLRSHELLTRQRLNYEKRTVITDPNRDGFSTFVTNTWTRVAFILGDNIGLFPTPATTQNLIITYNGLLPDLVNDSDTNFFLEIGYDFILSMALLRFTQYLKEDVRVETLEKRSADDWASLLAWDSVVRSGINQELGVY
jgi:hypothetical protein